MLLTAATPGPSAALLTTATLLLLLLLLLLLPASSNRAFTAAALPRCAFVQTHCKTYVKSIQYTKYSVGQDPLCTGSVKQQCMHNITAHLSAAAHLLPAL
jgi:hypothetical protein